jgi:hypothetical protein
VKGNIILVEEELKDLRRGLIEKYIQLTGDYIADPDSLFNSNIENYTRLYESMDEHVSLKKQGIKSSKGLLSLLYNSKKNISTGKSFRRKFIDSVYLYIYGRTRDETQVGQTNITDRLQPNFLENINGYWECYYFNDYSFRNKLDSGELLDIKSIAINIKTGTGGNNIRYIHSKRNYGTATVDIFGSNVAFRLKNEYDNSKSYLLMNCGKGSIQNAPDHLEMLSGIYSFPLFMMEGIKAVRCIMLYRDRNKVNDYYKMPEIDLLDENVKSIFFNDRRQLSVSSKMDLQKEALHITSFFYKPHNLTAASTFEFVVEPTFNDGFKKK